MANGKIDGSEILRLDEIEVIPQWNVRSNNEESQRGPEEAGTFETFVKSIFNEGQDTPIIVRKNPKDGAKKPYVLVSGNRRYEAHVRIAAAGKDPAWAQTGWCKSPTIKANIRALNEIQAYELNLRENTEREDVSTPDLAFGVGRLCDAYRKSGIKYTQNLIADKVGYSQGYISQLMAIMGEGKAHGVKPELLHAWRSAPIKLNVTEMLKVASLPLADQDKAYAELLRPAENTTGGQGDPMKAAAKGAANVGKMLGTLVREGALDLELDEEWWNANIDLIVKIKNRAGKNGAPKPPTEGQIMKIAKVAETTFNNTIVENEVSDSEQPKKGKRARNTELRPNN